MFLTRVPHEGSSRGFLGFLDRGSTVPRRFRRGTVALSSVVRIGGPFPQAVQAVMGGALIAESFETAARIAPTVPYPVATLEGDVFRGRHVVTGGEKTESRGILATKREIKELREKIAASRAALEQLIDETAGFEQAIAHATAAIAGLVGRVSSAGKGDCRRRRPERARRRGRVPDPAAQRAGGDRDQPRQGRDRRP